MKADHNTPPKADGAEPLMPEKPKDSLGEETSLTGEAATVPAPPPWADLIDHEDWASANESLATVRERMWRTGVDYMAVLEGEDVLGLCSQRALDEVLSERGSVNQPSRQHEPVRAYLVPEPIIIKTTDSFDDALDRMVRRDQRDFFDDVILTDPRGKYYGLIFARSLMVLQNRLMREQHDLLKSNLEKMHAMAQKLNDSNKELLQARDLALEATRMKSEFLATMSHEIRTPMNGVLGMINILLETPLSNEQKHFASIVRSSAESLLTIINDILDFSKIEAGKMELECVSFDLRELVEDVVQLLSQRAHEKGLELFCWIENNVPTRLMGDPTRIRQIVLNLIGNAIKFTRQGEVNVRVEKRMESKERVTLFFSVSDTGIGISPAAQARLFKPFSQADGSTTRKYGGTGLGLAICKSLVEAMRGTVGVKSTPGAGSTFYFTLDLEKAAPAEADAGTSTRKRELPGLRVLLVDDFETILMALSALLEAWGIDVKTATSGEEGLQALRDAASAQTPFDLVILDYQMPGMDGLETARRISEDPSINRTRSIMLTAYAYRLKPEDYKAAGLACVLEKPTRSSELYNAIQKLVGKRGPEQAPKKTGVSRKSRRSLHILIAEDSETNQEVALYQIQQLGHTGEAVSDGRQALEALTRKHFDLVLMDGHMPEMDGFETTQRIRDQSSSVLNHGIYITAMTANAMQGDKERCLAAGMDDYVSKPVLMDDLYDAIDRCIGHLESKGTAPGPAAAAAPPPLFPPVSPAQAVSKTPFSRATTVSLGAGTPGPGVRPAASVAATAQRPAPPPPQPTPLEEDDEPDDSPYFPAKLVDLFVQETTKRIIEIQNAYEAKDVPLLTRIAHTMKGTAGNFRAQNLRELSEEIEILGRAGNLTPIRDILPRLQPALEEAKKKLRPPAA